jgi:hypothetical protein
MSEVGNAFVTLLVWYGVAVVGSLIGGIGGVFTGNFSGLPFFLYGGISFGSIGASVYLGIKNRGWKLLWVAPAVVLPFAFVLISRIVAGPAFGPGEVEVSDSFVSEANVTFVVLTLLVLGVMIWGLRPDWSTAAAITTFCATLSVVAVWLGNAALTHMVS